MSELRFSAALPVWQCRKSTGTCTFCRVSPDNGQQEHDEQVLSERAFGERPIDRQIYALVRSRLHAEPLRIVDDGGSSARVVLLRLQDGRRHVLKYLQHKPGLVDGHDLESLHKKVRQMQMIHAQVPALRNHYAQVCEVLSGNDWLAFTMPFYEGVDIAADLRLGGQSVDDFYTQLGFILDDLVINGYSRLAVTPPSGYVNRTQFDRLERRWWLFREHLDPGLVEADVLVINGRLCASPLRLLERLRDDARVMALLSPGNLSYPVHGDPHVRNILVDRTDRAPESTYRMIDPRGESMPWDAMYDFAKIAFSLSVWDGALRQGFRIDELPPQGGRLAYDVAYTQGVYAPYLAATNGFTSFLASQSNLLAVVAPSSTWVERLWFAHAMHLLAEAACRLSDARSRPGLGAGPSPVQLSLGHFLYGTLFLNHIADALLTRAEFDVDSHLMLLNDL